MLGISWLIDRPWFIDLEWNTMSINNLQKSVYVALSKGYRKKGCNFVLMELKLLKCIYPAQWHGNKGTEQCVHVREFNKGAFRVEGQKITWAEYKAQLSERSEWHSFTHSSHFLYLNKLSVWRTICLGAASFAFMPPVDWNSFLDIQCNCANRKRNERLTMLP